MRAIFSNRQHAAAVLLWLLSLVPSLLCAEQGLLYELSREGRSPSYLFGTMHTDEPAVLQMVGRLAGQFDGADRLVLEMVLDMEALEVSARGMLLPEGESLSALLGKEAFDELLPLAAGYGLGPDVLDRMKPWAVAVTLSLPPSRTNMFLDQVLYLRALEQGKPVYGLEDASEQLSVFDRMSPELQLSMLADTVRQHHLMSWHWQQLLEAYLTRDLSLLERLSRQQMNGMGDGIEQWLQQWVIQERNRLMLDRLLPLLAEGGVFVAVGALHLPGDTGLLQGLRQAGFEVKAVW